MKRYFWRKRTFPFISLALLFLIYRILNYYININHKDSVFLLMVGFGLAALRSLFKECRLLKEGKVKAEKLRKHWIDMLWTYALNYPIILGLIYILGTYFLRKHPYYISWAILFGLGFFVDDVFNRPLDIFRP